MENIETKQQFISLRAKGNSFQKIADELGVSKQTLITWSHALQADIHNQRSLEYDNLLFQYQLNRENQLKTFSELIQKVTTELVSRKLTDLSTDKVFLLYFKIIDGLKDIQIPLKLEKESTWDIEPTKSYWET